MFASFLARPSQSIELVDIFNFSYSSELSLCCTYSKIMSIVLSPSAYILFVSWLLLPIIGQIMQLFMQMPQLP